MKPEIVELLIRGAVIGKILGLVGMFQPWDIRFFEYGFYLVALCTLFFIIAVHLPIQELPPPNLNQHNID